MINKVELVKLGQKGITVTEDAVSSLIQSKTNVSTPKAVRRIDAAQVSAARARRPVARHSNVVKNMETIENAKSFAISHGTPAEQVQVKSIDYLA